jgi:DNA processing protein
MLEQIRQITNISSEYPTLLKEIAHPPQRLWLKGAKLNSTEKHLTVVGSRKPSHYGIKIVNQLVKELAASGITIVSGLAIGIDGLAHQAALEGGGKTIAIMAAGLDLIYPTSNIKLSQSILAQGGTLVSEYPEGMPPLKQNFIARNRIQSGLSEAVLIIECAEKSGTLITAQFALEQNRLVLAVPGAIDNPMSAGPNNLIKQGAIPVTSAKDVLEALGMNIKASKLKEYQPENSHEAQILKLIKTGTYAADELQAQTEQSTTEFSSTLTMLEIKGIIKQTAPGQWDIL